MRERARTKENAKIIEADKYTEGAVRSPSFFFLSFFYYRIWFGSLAAIHPLWEQRGKMRANSAAHTPAQGPYVSSVVYIICTKRQRKGNRDKDGKEGGRGRPPSSSSAPSPFPLSLLLVAAPAAAAALVPLPLCSPLWVPRSPPRYFPSYLLGSDFYSYMGNGNLQKP